MNSRGVTRGSFAVSPAPPARTALARHASQTAPAFAHRPTSAAPRRAAGSASPRALRAGLAPFGRKGAASPTHKRSPRREILRGRSNLFTYPTGSAGSSFIGASSLRTKSELSSISMNSISNSSYPPVGRGLKTVAVIISPGFNSRMIS